MAIVKCHECGKEISIDAKICQQCGARNKDRKTKTFKRVLALVLATVIASVGALLAATSPNHCESYAGRKVFT
ncbi:MAG: zinc-ribbon domain-containing protein, partial [Nitrospira sp.]|nr:zinc-ribbon domain-containing protein [Nitrospira sp.]